MNYAPAANGEMRVGDWVRGPDRREAKVVDIHRYDRPFCDPGYEVTLVRGERVVITATPQSYDIVR